MKIFLSPDEREMLGVRSRLFRNLTPKEKELVTLYREHRSVRAENRQYELRQRFQYELSRNRVLKSAGDVEYSRERPQRAPGGRTTLTRVPGFVGQRFQFNSAGRPDAYPFTEAEEWVELPRKRFEGDEIFFRNSDSLDWLMGWSPQSLGLGGQFPREMMPGSLSSIRVMTGLDLLRFQSKVMFETIAPYSGVVNHLINYTCGDTGAGVEATSKTDRKLAQEVSDYLLKWGERVNFQRKVRQSCNMILVQGEFLPRRWRDGRITLMDPSWLRGPHNEIGQNPWAYGVLSPNWPFEVETVGAYSLWYPSNEVEIVSPLEMCHGKLDSSVGPSVKRSVPLSYRIRPLLPLLETMIQAMGTGEIKRQRIAGIISFDGADEEDVKKMIHPSTMSALDIDDTEDYWGGGPAYDEASGFYRIPNTTKYDAPPTGTAAAQSGVEAYNKIATVCANTVGVAPWMFGADFDEASRATSLTAAEPSVKTGKALQSTLSEVWECVARTELAMNLESPYTKEQLDQAGIRLHVRLPNVEVRDMEALYDRLSKQMADGLKDPQGVCAEMGDDFEEVQELIKQAEAMGWQKPQKQAENGEKGPKDELARQEAPDRKEQKSVIGFAKSA